MMLPIDGVTGLRIGNFKPDTAVEGSKMRAAEFVVGNLSVPCIIRFVSYGKVGSLNEKVSMGRTSIIIYERGRHTAHTRKGFVDVMIIAPTVLFYVYIHISYLERFLGACAMTRIRAGLKLLNL